VGRGAVSRLGRVSCAAVAEDTWQTEERPILEVVRAGEVSGEHMDSFSAGAAVGLDEADAGWTVQALLEAGS
jgi:hypothetical protein